MMKKIRMAGVVSATLIAGGAVGAGLIGSASAATAPSPGTGTATTTTTPWHSRTDAAHEAGESAARQAEEKVADATGIRPPGDGDGPRRHSDTDPAHEAGESAAHAAQEKIRDFQVAPEPTASPTG